MTRTLNSGLLPLSNFMPCKRCRDESGRTMLNHTGASGGRATASRAVPLFVFLSLSAFGSYAWAQGFATSGQGTRPIGMQGAHAGIADEPTAVFYNPAGLTQIKGTAVLLDALVLRSKVKYVEPSGVGEASDVLIVAPSIFASAELEGSLSLGFGMYTPFGRGTDYADAPGRKSETARVDFTLAAACPITPELSVGAGLTLAYGTFFQRVPPLPGVMVEDDADGIGFGATVGALYMPVKDVRIGLTYRSRITVEMDGEEGVATPVGGTSDEFDLTVHYPGTLALGASAFLADSLLVGFTVEWMEWSYMGHLTFDYETSPALVVRVDGRDTVSYRFGIEVRATRELALLAGYSFRPQAVPDRRVAPTFPDFDTHNISLAAQWAAGPWRLGIAYEHIAGSNEVDDNAGGFNGDYDIRVNTLFLDVTYAF